MKVKYAVSASVSILIFFVSLYKTMALGMTNIEAYIVSVMISCLCFFILFLFSFGFTKIKKQGNAIIVYKLERIIASNSGGGIPAIIMLLFIGMAYFLDSNTNDMLGKYIFVDKYVFLITIILALILFFPLRKALCIRQKIIRKCLEIINLVVCAWIGFKPNVLGDTFNYNAYWLNVVQIYNHVPFDSANLSFYGHYSLLMLPYFRMFGLSAITVALLQAVENIIICIAITYCIHKITENELLKICGIIGVLYYVGGTAFHYPQGFPHRLVFVAVMLALGCKVTYSPNKKLWLLLGYMVSFFAIIWSTEVGVVVLVAWSILAFMYVYFLERSWKKKVVLCTIVIILIPIVFICSWECVSLINKLYLKGQWITLNEFVFPLQNGDFTSILAYKVDFKMSPWIIVMVLFLATLFWGIKGLVLRWGEKETILLTYISAMGLMNLTYFFNRAAWGNLRLVAYYPSILIGLILMGKLGFSNNNKSVKMLLREGILWGGLSLFILMATIFIIKFPSTFIGMMRYQDIEGMNKFFTELDEKIPFSVMGLDYETAFYLMESEKINDGYYESVVNYSALSMNETRKKLLKAQSPFMVDSRIYITNYLFAWGIITEEELDQLYDEYVSFEYDENEYVIFWPKNMESG